ncbi:MAG: hypothetical protein FJ106_10145 [Deltaproteobacteria bacterium]|nr:hypothetical protein [Deltaproteobacteria bacterium]
MTRFIFTVLSIAYIASIFFLAGSPIVQISATFNPYGLLHIPLYGVLTLLLIFSIIPFGFSSSNPTNPIDQRNQKNRFLFAGLIALGVAVADEIYQIYVPGRKASATDILLDAIGIVLVLLVFHRIFKPIQTGVF